MKKLNIILTDDEHVILTSALLLYNNRVHQFASVTAETHTLNSKGEPFTIEQMHHSQEVAMISDGLNKKIHIALGN